MLGEVAELIDSSVHTARRRLKQWRVLTSYNQNGRYYALPEVAEFDAAGLWRCRGVFFSQYGNLKQTLIELIHRSPAGLDAGEIRSASWGRAAFVSFRVCRSSTAQETRKRQDDSFYDALPVRFYAAQQQRRDAMIWGSRPTPFEAIAILVEKIKHPALSHETLSRRLRKQKLFVEPETIDNLFARYGLAGKKHPIRSDTLPGRPSCCIAQ